MGNELVARDGELGELLALVRHGAGAVVCGEAGVGKTALASAVAAQVAADGDHVERVVATAAARPMPFGALAPLLPDDLMSLHPALVLGTVVRRLRGLDSRGQPLIVVDDAQLLDDQSAATVLGLVTSGVVRLLATIRTGDVPSDAILSLWKDRLVPRVDISPFDRTASRQFLRSCLGGEVAVTTAELFWQQTRGNALYLGELARHAQRNGDVREDGGVWMWFGDFSVPPRLADLLDQRFDDLGPAADQALGALVLGEPLPLETLTTVASEEALADLERRALITVSERDGSIEYRFAHPLLAAAASRRLTPTLRRQLAKALIAAEDGGADPARRATWQLEAGVEPDVAVLIAGAKAALLTNPAFARRLAERAAARDPSPEAALTLADANAELGEIEAAREAQALAQIKVRDDDDRVSVVLNQASLTAFSERRPDLGLAIVARARVELPARCYPDLDSCAALLTAFSAQPAKALMLADEVLATNPPRRCVIRATSARVACLALVDRPDESVRAASELLAYVAAGPASPYAQGVAHIMVLVANVTRTNPLDPLPTDPAAGRWPVPLSADAIDRRVEAVSFPLFDGARRLFEGHLKPSIPLLREAVAQQRVGEGLLRSEAVGLLAIALASAGRVAEAEQLLADDPPDRLAIYSGLGTWAAAVIDAAAGRPGAAALAFAAADEAHRAGAVVSFVAYLAEAARFGAAAEAAARLDSVGVTFRSPFTNARALEVRARATGDGKSLLEAAEAHATLGLAAPALQLAELAAAALGRGSTSPAERARSLAAELRRRLGQADIGPVSSVPLTRRELEIAKLAAKGMSDRDIADLLVVSVRTVESHLASVYRKLDISSRRGLRSALPETI